MNTSGAGDLSIEGHQGSGSELIFFSFSGVAAATDNFSNENKLGQGGFGPVYKVSFHSIDKCVLLFQRSMTLLC